MDELGSADIFLFGGFRLDRRGGVLFRLNPAGGAEPVVLGSRAFDLLSLLVERHGELISKDVIMSSVWPGRVVEEANLNVQISRLRDTLGHGSIQTVPGHGYRFVAPVTQPEPVVHAAVPAISRSAQPRPHLSIVVLPFTNLSDDREQQYFADGITADLTTDLSRLADLFVISRRTAFTYRDKVADTKQIGRELEVRYVLEGSVRRSGSQIRINVQLIDAESDAHLWAERFDCDMGDLFALQNEITSRIAVKLDLELVGAEAARQNEHPDALDYLLRGRAAMARDDYGEAAGLFEQALALSPRSAEAQSWLAIVLAGRVLDDMGGVAAADIARAEALAGQALVALPDRPLAHVARAQVLRAQQRFDEAIAEYEAALVFNGNLVFAITSLGSCKVLTGSIEEAIGLYEQAVRLSPRDARIGDWYDRIGGLHLLRSRTDTAIRWLEKARAVDPGQSKVHAYLAAAYALKGETERGSFELAEARRLSSDDRFSSIARLKAVQNFGSPAVRALHEATFFAGLRKAGMPEE